MGTLKGISTFSHPVSLLIWLVLQLMVLLLPVTQVQLSEEFPRPAEKMAADEMIVAQIALGALLFPVLMRDLSSALVLAAATWPFLLLAGLLSSTPHDRLLEAGAFVFIWMIGLGLLRAEWHRWNARAAAIASTYAVGGAFAAYLRAEFSSGRIDGLLFGPIVGGLDILNKSETRWRGWIVLPVFLIAAVVLRIVSHRRRTSSQQVMHSFCG